MRSNGSDPSKISEFPFSVGLEPSIPAISGHFAVRDKVSLAIGATMSNNEIAQFATPEVKQNGLTAVQFATLSALLSGLTMKAATELASVDLSTVHSWLRDDWHFRAATIHGT